MGDVWTREKVSASKKRMLAVEFAGDATRNLSKWGKQSTAGTLEKERYQNSKPTVHSKDPAQTPGDDVSKLEGMVLKRARACRTQKWRLLRKKLQRRACAFAEEVLSGGFKYADGQVFNFGLKWAKRSNVKHELLNRRFTTKK